MQAATDEVCRVLGCDVSWTGTVEGSYLVMGAHCGLESAEMTASWRLQVGHGIGGRVAEEGRAIASRDYRHDSRRVPIMKRVIDEEGIMSTLTVPLLAGEDVLGVLYGANREVHDWTEEEIAAATDIGRDLSVRMTLLAEEERVRHDLLDADRDRAGLDRALRNAKYLAESYARGDDVRRGLELLAHDLQMAVELRRTDGRMVNFTAEGRDSAGQVRWRGDIGTRRSHVLVVSGDRELSVSESAMVGVFAALVGLQMTRQQERFFEELRLTSRFLESVLAAQPGDYAEIVADASLLGIDLTTPAYIVYLGMVASTQDSPSVLAAHDVDLATSAMADRFPGSVVTPRNNDLVAIVFTEEPVEVVRSGLIDKVLPSLANSTVWVGGIGRHCAGLTDYSASFEEARFALGFAQSGEGAATIVVAADLAGSQLTGRAARESVERQINEALGPMLRSDTTSGTEYVKTLEAFLKNDRSLASTAASLHVHSNTVRYRIGKIEELLGASLRDVDERFRLESALRLRSTMSQGSSGAGHA